VILSAGFCESLREGFHVGDVVLASEVSDEEGNRWPATWPGELPAGEWRPPLHRGRVLTVSNLPGTPDQRRLLGREREALTVDTESAMVARECARRDIPFGCVRVVSEEVDAPPSPASPALLSGGLASTTRTLGLLVRRPGLAAPLWRLAKRTAHAADQLGNALGELLTLTLPFSVD
jgi:hypothetical protein